MTSTTLAVDFGSKHIGVALVEHSRDCPNRVLYAATLTVAAKPLKDLVEPRAMARRIRRTRKTHRRRLQRLAQSLSDVRGADAILRFCRRRGFSYDSGEEQDEQSFHISREEFFAALGAEVDRIIAPRDREQVLRACRRHLNSQRKPSAEIRPARFENRGRSRCNWTGCRNNVARAGHDLPGRLQQSLFLWLQPIFQESPDPKRLQGSLEHWIDELGSLGTAYHRLKSVGSNSDEHRKQINRRISRVNQNLLARVLREAPGAVGEKFENDWQEYYKSNLSDIIRGEAGGRVRFCRRHSGMFVDYTLAGKPIPVRQDLTEKTLFREGNKSFSSGFGGSWKRGCCP